MPKRLLAQDITFYDLKSIFKNSSRAHLSPTPPHPWAGWLWLRVALRDSVFPVWTGSCLLGMWDEGWSRKLSVSILLPGKPKFRKEGTSAGGKGTCKGCGKALIMSPLPPSPRCCWSQWPPAELPTNHKMKAALKSILNWIMFYLHITGL